MRRFWYEFGDLITMLLVTLLSFAAAFAIISTVLWFAESARCEAYGRQTGREAVYDWRCYARNDEGEMVPASQIGANLTIKQEVK